MSFDLADWKMKFSNSFVTIGHILHDYLQILQNQTIIALIETWCMFERLCTDSFWYELILLKENKDTAHNEWPDFICLCIWKKTLKLKILKKNSLKLIRNNVFKQKYFRVWENLLPSCCRVKTTHSLARYFRLC